MDAGISLTVLVVGDGEAATPVREALDEVPGLTVVGDASSADLDAAVADGAPDVVVVLLSADGSELVPVRALASHAMATRFVAVVPADAELEPAALVEANIGAVVREPVDARLGEVVVGLARGEGFLDGRMAQYVVDRHRGDGPGTELTPTEEEVLGRLAAGASAEEIAAEHAVSPRLVRMHAAGPLARLFRT